MKLLILKLYHLIRDDKNKTIPLQQWLFNQMLHGSQSRSRTKFVKILLERLAEFEENRIKLAEEYADKVDYDIVDGGKEVRGDDNTPRIVYLDKSGIETTDKSLGVNYRFSPDQQIKFEEEYGKYIQEDCIIDVTPANQVMIDDVRSILLSTSQSFEAKQAELYDEWCEAFENISSTLPSEQKNTSNAKNKRVK